MSNFSSDVNKIKKLPSLKFIIKANLLIICVKTYT